MRGMDFRELRLYEVGVNRGKKKGQAARNADPRDVATGLEDCSPYRHRSLFGRLGQCGHLRHLSRYGRGALGRHLVTFHLVNTPGYQQPAYLGPIRLKICWVFARLGVGSSLTGLVFCGPLLGFLQLSGFPLGAPLGSLFFLALLLGQLVVNKRRSPWRLGHDKDSWDEPHGSELHVG
jgi:hypothetical protein